MKVESILLFGEGKTEGIFLSHIKNLYAKKRNQKIKVSYGQGGSPDSIVNYMIRSKLQLAYYDKSILFIDEDVKIKKSILKKIKKWDIDCVCSQPKCIEGMILVILGKLPKGGIHASSKDLKRHCRKILGAKDHSDFLKKLSRQINSLLPKELLDEARASNNALDEVIKFVEG